MGFHAADLAGFLVEIHLKARNIGAETRIDRPHAFRNIRCAANDLKRSVFRFDFADIEFVGVRVLLDLLHLCKGEIREGFGRVLDAFDFQTGIGHGGKNFIQARFCLQMVLQPGNSELHDGDPSAIGVETLSGASWSMTSGMASQLLTSIGLGLD